MAVGMYKNFGGIRYAFYRSHFTKAEAEHDAVNRRKNGYKVRITKRMWGSKKTGGKVTDYIVWVK